MLCVAAKIALFNVIWSTEYSKRKKEKNSGKISGEKMTCASHLAARSKLFTLN